MLEDSEFCETLSPQAGVFGPLADSDRFAGLSFVIAAATEAHRHSHPNGQVWVVSDQPRLNQSLCLELEFWGVRAYQLLEIQENASTSVLDDPEAHAARLHTLALAANRNADAAQNSRVFITADLTSACPAPHRNNNLNISLSVGQQYDPDALQKQLAVLGFEQVTQIHGRGQYAVRGGIIDVFTWQSPLPLRLEFFDTELESLREFDLNTQTSVRRLQQAEIVVDDAENDAELADYVMADDLVICLPTVEMVKGLRNDHNLLRLSSDPLLNTSINPSPLGAFEAGDFVLQENKRHAFSRQLAEWHSSGWKVHLVFSNKGEIERFTELMGEGILAGVETMLGDLNHGFTLPSLRLAVLSSAELFGRYQTRQTGKNTTLEHQRRAQALSDMLDISKGDLVVHSEYGIGRFQKIERDADGHEEIKIRYRDGATLAVPIEQAHLLAKYVGMGGKEPMVSKLGDGKWSKTRKAAEKSIMDYAAHLLRLQAQRETLQGEGHPPDTRWMWEFESSFIYTETPDQLRAIEDTKADMESKKPMDRLICGDVGFGKTEVAIRAAFKAVTGGKQAAVLVPTTVLAEQHWRTFRERMSDYPVRIELLNRFRKPSEIRDTLQGLADGSVDIVIGTHRLISKDVIYHDLGVAVIDEEQRFGVKHKERFKELFAGVDLLTLSATPIPRTLYLSLMGTRDMSTIDTPPPNKVPVQTTICGYDERIIRTAIERELERGGQVFFLHNRVKTIEMMREKILALVPDAKVVIGHGQMEKHELEAVMHQFVQGQADILLATTIIESGIDIPNANTIIIDRADRFGLADLYQLRGRVGRGGQNAYAILLIPRDLTTGGDARKRINAIKQYTALGSGFKIAMRDLEIRGAGNLLGTKQSGHIANVGFELYCQLLRQSIERLRGNKNTMRINVTLRADFLNFTETAISPADSKQQLNAYIPANYMTDASMRIRAYKQLAEASSMADISALKASWRDQYGKLPTPLQNLLLVTELKIAASKANISSVEIKSQRLMLTRNNQYIMFSQTKFPRLHQTEAKKKLIEAIEMLRTI